MGGWSTLDKENGRRIGRRERIKIKYSGFKTSSESSIIQPYFKRNGNYVKTFNVLPFSVFSI